MFILQDTCGRQQCQQTYSWCYLRRDGGLLKSLWGEAVETAIMMINLSPTAAEIFSCLGSKMKPTAPFDAWTGLYPNAGGLDPPLGMRCVCKRAQTCR